MITYIPSKKNAYILLTMVALVSIYTLYLISNRSLFKVLGYHYGVLSNLASMKISLSNSVSDLSINPSEIILVNLSSQCDCKQNQSIIVTRNNRLKLINAYLYSNATYSVERLLFSLPESDFNSRVFTCNAYNTFRRGLNQKIIGYSFFGPNGRYFEKLHAIGAQVKELYPGWYARVYHDKSIDSNLVCRTECWSRDKYHRYVGAVDTVDFCDVTQLSWTFDNLKKSLTANVSYVNAAKWRWFPLADSVSVIVRIIIFQFFINNFFRFFQVC